MKLKIPRILIASAGSRSGKTVLSAALMRILSRKGYKVAPFKVGPDFIDPSYHQAALNLSLPSRNLDSFLMKRKDIVQSFSGACHENSADIAVIEGVMGLYDSYDALHEEGSTAHVAKILKAPVLLICDVERIARSAGAIVLGCREFDREVSIKGVVLNRVGSARHEEKARSSVEKFAGIKVVGAVKKDASLHVPERHLGLIPAYELNKELDSLSSAVEKYIDVEKIIEIANSAPAIEVKKPKFRMTIKKQKLKKTKIGIVYDNVFRFYYPETIEQLSERAEVTFIDSMKDKKLPDIDVLYIGGGFPEVFAEKLEKNKQLRSRIYDFCESGKKVYAECGGLLYLGKSIVTKEGEEFEMVGFLPIKTEMQERYVGLGYVKNIVIKNNPMSRKGEALLGHEFHHSKVTLTRKAEFVYKTERGLGIANGKDGMLIKSTLASYMHLHPLSYKNMIKNLVS